MILVLASLALLSSSMACVGSKFEMVNGSYTWVKTCLKPRKMIGSRCWPVVFCSFGHHSIKWAFEVPQVFVCALRSLSIISKVAAIGPQVNFFHYRKIIHELRLLKSDSEIRLMDRSCVIGSSSIRDTIRSTLSLANEAQAFATVDYHCRMKGS